MTEKQNSFELLKIKFLESGKSVSERELLGQMLRYASQKTESSPSLAKHAHIKLKAIQNISHRLLKASNF